MLSQLEFRVKELADEQLEKATHDWLREAVFFIGGSWYSNRKEVKTVYGVSEKLKLRWILSKGAPRVLIEQKERNTHWLGGYSIGNNDPFAFDYFSRYYGATDDKINTVEAIVKTYLPQIEIVQCYFCGGRFENEITDSGWCCPGCIKKYLTTNPDKSGFVYVFGSKADGYFKIGCGDTPNSRMSSYRGIGLPFQVEMIYVIPTDDKRKAEAELHWVYREQHTNGEWYKLSPDDLARLENVKRYVEGQWVRG